MEVKIETATSKLLDQLYQIEEQCFDQEAFSKRQISYLLSDYNAISLVAKVNSDLAGFIITQVEVEENTQFGHIITINVAPSFRRKKIGTKLLQEVETLLKQKGISESRLEVREDNHHAIKLYQALNYQVVGKLEKLLRQETRLYFKKTL